MRRFSIVLILLLISCSNKRVVELPEISRAEISEVLDVSPAYIFYDESEKDSVLFNRKNLIGTTNWLVNVDRRLRLKQAMPHLEYLQNKRRKKGMHTNENARNYFTCNDISRKTLGFLDFTESNFILGANQKTLNQNNDLKMIVYSLDEIELKIFNTDNIRFSSVDLSSVFSNSLANYEGPKTLTIAFHNELNFQDYISIKESLIKLIEVHNLKIEDEFFLNMKFLN